MKPIHIALTLAAALALAGAGFLWRRKLKL
jgi:hypothetical protein